MTFPQLGARVPVAHSATGTLGRVEFTGFGVGRTFAFAEYPGSERSGGACGCARTPRRSAQTAPLRTRFRRDCRGDGLVRAPALRRPSGSPPRTVLPH